MNVCVYIKTATELPKNVELFVFIEKVLSVFVRTWNEPECVHLFVIELKHPIFGFELSNIELHTYIVQPTILLCLHVVFYFVIVNGHFTILLSFIFVYTLTLKSGFV